MPTFKRQIDVGANGLSSPLTGWQYETPNFDAMLEVSLLADAGDALEAFLSSGSDVLANNDSMDTLAVATPMEYPQHFQYTDFIGAGEKVVAQIREVAGAASTYRIWIKLTPV